MKKTLIITLFYVFFSHSAFASLDGELQRVLILLFSKVLTKRYHYQMV